jgi:hypothetical protein
MRLQNLVLESCDFRLRFADGLYEWGYDGRVFSFRGEFVPRYDLTTVRHDDGCSETKAMTELVRGGSLCFTANDGFKVVLLLCLRR